MQYRVEWCAIVSDTVHEVSPHLVPTNTGQPACLVVMSPSPDCFKFHQKVASPWRERDGTGSGGGGGGGGGVRAVGERYDS